MNRTAYIFISIFMLLTIRNLNAEIFHVRPSGSSYGAMDGTDWNNAFNGFGDIKWNVINPGDTIFISGGLYTTGLNIQASGIPGNPITIKRATIIEHGSGIGWQDSFDTQVLVRAGSNISDFHHIIIDGVTWGGIYIHKGTGSGGYAINLTPGNSNPSNYITLRYLKIEGPGKNLGSTYANSQGIHSAGAATQGTHLTLQYCEVFNYSGAVCRLDVDDMLVEYCVLHDTSDPVNHVDLIQTYHGSGTYRYNIGYNSGAAGFAFADNSGPFYVYGNLLYDIQNGIECQRDTEIYVYNNTIVRCNHGLDTTTRFIPSSGSVYNNLFYDNAHHFLIGENIIHDYNWYYPSAGIGGDNGENNGQVGFENPFIDINNNDFHLSTATNSGITNLGFPFNMDMDGNIRGLDGTWDIGAFEFNDGLAAERPNAPSGLRITN